ncbi:MAG: response regulator [Phycisphaera sp.]|nr:response regulator [Phycisphaera sp.]
MVNQRGPKVLVVDDDRMSVLMIARVASSLGCRCVTARTGASGWREFVRTRFDLVVSDLNMPGGDGAVLARRIRAKTNVPVLLVTALDAATPTACGVVGLEGIEVLRKPVVPPRLREAIEDRLENSLPAMLEAA